MTSAFRAVARLVRRAAAPMALAATLATLAVLSWPTEVTETAAGPGAGRRVSSATAPDGSADVDAAAEADDDIEGTGAEPDSTAGNQDSVSAVGGNGPADDGAGVPAAGEAAVGTAVKQPTGVAKGPTTAADDESCFVPLFRDDFDQDQLDPAWQVYDSDGNHSPHAVRKAEAVSVEDGILTITAANDGNGVATSGGLRLTYTQAYGRYAFRVRTDRDLTNTTSGVVLTWPVSESQPLDGENNIYETLRAPGSRAPFYSFIHEPFDQSGDGISQVEFTHLGDGTKWQELAMDWTPDHIAVTWTDPATDKSTTQRFDETDQDLITDAEHFLAIQLDLFKGSFPDDRSVTMEVDWVEVHSYCG